MLDALAGGSVNKLSNPRRFWAAALKCNDGPKFKPNPGNPRVANGAILKLAPLSQRKIVGIRAFGSKPAIHFASSARLARLHWG
jgi:hypothetical protein